MLAFIEYVTTDPTTLSKTWQTMGLTASPDENCFVSEDVCLLTIPPEEGRGFLDHHGSGLTGFGLKVGNIDLILKKALQSGITVSSKGGRPMLELMDTVRITLLPQDWTPSFSAAGPLQSIDHLALNVVFGTREKWCDLMETLFGFKRQTTFSIRGKQTGFTGSSILSPCGAFRLVINESDEKESQINTFIKDRKGKGSNISLFPSRIFFLICLPFVEKVFNSMIFLKVIIKILKIKMIYPIRLLTRRRNRVSFWIGRKGRIRLLFFSRFSPVHCSAVLLLKLFSALIMKDSVRKT